MSTCCRSRQNFCFPNDTHPRSRATSTWEASLIFTFFVTTFGFRYFVGEHHYPERVIFVPALSATPKQSLFSLCSRCPNQCVHRLNRFLLQILMRPLIKKKQRACMELRIFLLWVNNTIRLRSIHWSNCNVIFFRVISNEMWFNNAKVWQDVPDMTSIIRLNAFDT